MELKQVYLNYYSFTKQEVYIYLLNMESQISQILAREREKRWGVGESIIYYFSQFLLALNQFYLACYFLTRWDVHIYLLNGELQNFHNLMREWKKGWGQLLLNPSIPFAVTLGARFNILIKLL